MRSHTISKKSRRVVTDEYPTLATPTGIIFRNSRSSPVVCVDRRLSLTYRTKYYSYRTIQLWQ